MSLHHHPAKRGIFKGCGGHGAENFSTPTPFPPSHNTFTCAETRFWVWALTKQGGERVWLRAIYCTCLKWGKGVLGEGGVGKGF